MFVHDRCAVREFTWKTLMQLLFSNLAQETKKAGHMVFMTIKICRTFAYGLRNIVDIWDHARNVTATDISSICSLAASIQ